MAELTFFTLDGVVSAVDGQRDAGDPKAVATYGALTVTALIESGDAITGSTLVPPQSVHLPGVDGVIRNGKMTTSNGLPIRLVANTPVLGLVGDLYYRIDFHYLRSSSGEVLPKRSCTFAAPHTDVVVDFTTIAPVPGIPGVGITKGDQGDPGYPVDDVALVGSDPQLVQFYAHGEPVGDPLPLTIQTTVDITDVTGMGATGLQVAQADTQAEGRAAIGAASDAAVVHTADVGSTVQPHDADLDAIAALAPADNDVLQRKSGAWTGRTPAQLKADLALSAGDVGLGNVNNTSDLNKPISTATQTALNAKQSTSEKNQPNGYAGVDASGTIPPALLPSYVDDVLEYATTAAFPATGETGKIYVATGTGKIYRWGGSAYTEISPSPGSTDAVPEGATNLYYTNARADSRITAALGSTVQAYDADLAAIAALASAADKMPYATGAGAWALATLTPFARSILDDPDAAGVLATLGISSGTAPVIQEYTTATGGVTGAARPTGTKGVLIKKMIGAGGAGGSGAFNSATGTNRPGGGAGAGGNVVEEHWVPVSQLGATFDVQVGAKGVGGAAVTVTAPGNAGTAGGDAVFTSGSFSLRASGGGAGAGGSGSSGVGGTPGPYGDKLGTAGGAGTTSSVPAAAADSPTVNAGVRAWGGAAGGGGGSGISSAGTANTTAGAGGSTPTAAGGTGGTASGTAPTANGPLIAGEPGAGAGGGALNTATGTGQAGANGVGYGSGGGGGAGAGGSGGVTSGKGGDGGPSYVLLMWLF